MCGIAGIHGGGGDIRAMTRRLAHRGPDGEGFYADERVQLGVRRLAVIDVEGGRQPMTNARGDWIAYNGELFNWRDLRRELEGKGHRFLTNSDTEVVLNAYTEWGPNCVDRFVGMFAFAVWNGRILFIARDRLGEKPMFYARLGRRLLFASEIKALLVEVPREPNLDERFAVLEAVVEPETLFRGISSLQPGHWLTYDGEQLTIRRYWQLPDGPIDRRPSDALLEELRARLSAAVHDRLHADVPLGLFLSGGLDSSVIGALSRATATFTCCVPYGPAFDESVHADAMARTLGSEHSSVVLTPEAFAADLPRIVWHLDQPIATASSAAEFALARIARTRVKVVLGGQGADEAFGGYVRHVLLAEERRLGAAPLLHDYFPLARVLWGEKAFTDPADRYFELFHRGDGPAQPFLETIHRLFARHEGSLVNQMGAVDFALTFPSLIAMNDRAAAAYGLENRTPFLDHRLIEFAFRLPAHLKIDGLTTKVLLRRAARGVVPDAIVDRPDKKGLAVPALRWLSGTAREWAQDLTSALARRGIEIQPRVDRGEFDRSLFTRVTLELWFRTFIDRNGEGPIG